MDGALVINSPEDLREGAGYNRVAGGDNRISPRPESAADRTSSDAKKFADLGMTTCKVLTPRSRQGEMWPTVNPNDDRAD